MLLNGREIPATPLVVSMIVLFISPPADVMK
jgi:hypothetical protein